MYVRAGYTDSEAVSGKLSDFADDIRVSTGSLNGEEVKVVSISGVFSLNEAAKVEGTSESRSMNMTRNHLTDMMNDVLHDDPNNEVVGALEATSQALATAINDGLVKLLKSENGKDVLAVLVEGFSPELSRGISEGLINVKDAIDPGILRAVVPVLMSTVKRKVTLVPGNRSVVCTNGDNIGDKYTRPEMRVLVNGKPGAKPGSQRINVRDPLARYSMEVTLREGETPKAAMDRVARSTLAVIREAIVNKMRCNNPFLSSGAMIAGDGKTTKYLHAHGVDEGVYHMGWRET